MNKKYRHLDEKITNKYFKEYRPNFATSVKHMCIFGIFLHTLFLIIFIENDVKILIGFGLLGILGYIVIILSDIKKNIALYSIFAFLIAHIHSIMCVYYIGWNSGFYIYPFVLIPAIYFISMNVLKKDIFGHLSVLIILFTHWLVKELSTKYNIDDAITHQNIHSFLYIINTFSASFIFVNLIYSFLYEMRTMQYKLENMVNTDTLTGLKNRRYIIEKIEIEVEKFNETGDSFAVVIGDIDNFKCINDTYGHDCGDKTLKAIADILIENSKRLDINVCRWGGEEFLILIKNTDIIKAKKICEKILTNIRELKIKYGEDTIQVTITLGGCVYSDEIYGINKAIRQADKNLYKGKENGKDCVVI